MMMIARSTAVRLSSQTMARQSRLLSSQSTIALEKLRSLLEEYREKNYTQETPKRFKKEIIRAAASPDGSNYVGVEGLERVLKNIGYSNRITRQEIETMFQEVGDSNSSIPADRMIKLI